MTKLPTAFDYCPAVNDDNHKNDPSSNENEIAAVDRSTTNTNTISTTTTTNNYSKDLSQYHLLYSPNVPYQIVMWTLILYTVRQYINMMRRPNVSIPSSAFYSYVVLPLLSSACCSIQLLVNAMFPSVGCVGFNKVLGPFRPFFIAWLLLTSQRYVRKEVVIMKQQHGSLLLPSVLRIGSFFTVTWSMAFLPEFIHWKNHNTRVVGSTVPSNSFFVAPDDASTVNDAIQSTNQQVLMEIEFSIPSMGCVACIQKVTKSFFQQGIKRTSDITQFSIQDASSWLNGAPSNVLVNPKDVAEAIAQSIQQNGFNDCQVDTIQMLL